MSDVGMVAAAEAEVTAWVPDDGTFGARLALVRQRMGWNAKEAALACGLKYASWREWELNGREPHKLRDVCLQIATSTGCNHIWLQTGEHHPAPPVPPAGFEPAAFRSEEPLLFRSFALPEGAAAEDHDWIAPVLPISSTVVTN